MKNIEISFIKKEIEITFNNLSSYFYTKLRYKFINDYQLLLSNITIESKKNNQVTSIDLRSLNIFSLNKKSLTLIRRFSEIDQNHFYKNTYNSKFNSININKLKNVIKRRKFTSRNELLALYAYLYVFTSELTNKNITTVLSINTGYSESYIKSLNKEIFRKKYLKKISKGTSGGVLTSKTLDYFNSLKFQQY